MSEIITLLTKVMDDIGAVRKGEKNTHQNFNFRGIDAVVNAASPAFRKHGVVVVPTLNSVDYETVEVGQNRSRMASVRVNVSYTFHAPDGSNVVATVVAESMDSGDKATAKAMSVAFRIALLQTLCLPTDDIDPDAQTYERSAAPTKRVEKETVYQSQPEPKTVAKPRATVGSNAQPANQSTGGGVASAAQVKLIRDLIKQVDGDDELLSAFCNGKPEQLDIGGAKSVINQLLMLKRGEGVLLFDSNGRATVEMDGQ
jgi:hypothetical protein